jgi:glutamine synthetase
MAKPVTRTPGMLSVAELRQQVRSGAIDTVLVVFTDHYGRFVGKRFDASFFLDSALAHGAEACDYLLTVDMEMNPVAGYASASWEKGYGDFHLQPDLRTLRVASWLERSALVICDVLDPARQAPVASAPRNLLRRQVERARAAGFGAMAGSELEYYLYQDSYRDAATKPFESLQPAGWYLEDYHMLQGARTEPFHGAVRRALAASGVPVENSKGEWGRGQHELNIRYADVLEMADRHAIYKQCLKEVADQMGLSVTFMAKVDAAQAGSSCHLHLSLWRGGKAAFPVGAASAATGRARQSRLKPLPQESGSAVFRHFLAGWIAHASELMPCYAPTVNSYKRYQSASWAPTRLAWSRDNRTAGFRVVGQGDSLRIECRIPGADCNPYLAYAAALASGLDGIERKLEPPAAFSGDMYAAADLPAVPATLRDATDLFETSTFAREAFGDEAFEHYLHFFRTEQAAFDGAVTDWERKRYFERI